MLGCFTCSVCCSFGFLSLVFSDCLVEMFCRSSGSPKCAGLLLRTVYTSSKQYASATRRRESLFSGCWGSSYGKRWKSAGIEAAFGFPPASAAHLHIWFDWLAVDVFSSWTSVPSCPEASPGPAGRADWGLSQQNLHQPAPLLRQFESCWLYCVESVRHIKKPKQPKDKYIKSNKCLNFIFDCFE